MFKNKQYHYISEVETFFALIPIICLIFFTIFNICSIKYERNLQENTEENSVLVNSQHISNSEEENNFTHEIYVDEKGNKSIIYNIED